MGALCVLVRKAQIVKVEQSISPWFPEHRPPYSKLPVDDHTAEMAVQGVSMMVAMAAVLVPAADCGDDLGGSTIDPVRLLVEEKPLHR